MSCRACGQNHSPLLRCGVAARLASLVVNASNSVVNVESVVNKEPDAVVNSRQVVWQKSNRTRYNEKMREYMKRYRAAKKAASNAI